MNDNEQLSNFGQVYPASWEGDIVSWYANHKDHCPTCGVNLGQLHQEANLIPHFARACRGPGAIRGIQTPPEERSSATGRGNRVESALWRTVAAAYSYEIRNRFWEYVAWLAWSALIIGVGLWWAYGGKP